MKNELLKRARVKKRTGKRPTVGCFMPTDRQLVQELKRASWSIEIQEHEGKRLTRYRYEDSLSVINNTDKRRQGSDDGSGEQ